MRLFPRCGALSIGLAVFSAVLVSAGEPSIQTAQPNTRPAASFQIVELAGDPAEIGTQHGAQLGDRIKLLDERYLHVFLGSTVKRMMAVAAARTFEGKMLPEHLAEVRALADKSGIPLDDAALAQCFLDLTPMSACSTVTLPADAAPDHIARFGRNLDFPALDVADKQSMLFIYRPGDGRYKFASVGWPGMVGVLSGMNEHGLALASMEVTRSARLPTAMPYTLLYRTLLERCKTVDEAIALLEKTPRQTANNLMLMDAGGSRAVVEIQPTGIAVRRGSAGAALVSTNHQRGVDADTAGRCKRYDYLHDHAKQDYSRLDATAVEHLLAGASQGNFTLQSMVFEPSTLTLYLSTGHDAARREFQKVELSPQFSK